MGEPVCKGSYALGTACGKCARCKEYQERYDARKQVDDALSGRSSLRARIATLEAELAAARRCPLCGGRTQEIAVKVKPLVWSKWNEKLNYPDCSAITETGQWYKVDTSEARWEKPDFPVLFRDNCYRDFSRLAECNSLEAAKAAAQADYERRVMSALECAPVKSAQARPSVAEAAKALEAHIEADPTAATRALAAIPAKASDLASHWFVYCLRALAGEDSL